MAGTGETMHCCEGSEPNGGEGRGEERTGVGGRRAAEDAIDNQGGGEALAVTWSKWRWAGSGAGPTPCPRSDEI